MLDRQPQKVSLEDLLRLKRAEQPPPEFWSRFEQELRAKQLAAIVVKRPWWHTWSHSPRFVRLATPLSAAAALALAISIMRQPVLVRSAPRSDIAKVNIPVPAGRAVAATSQPDLAPATAPSVPEAPSQTDAPEVATSVTPAPGAGTEQSGPLNVLTPWARTDVSDGVTAVPPFALQPPVTVALGGDFSPSALNPSTDDPAMAAAGGENGRTGLRESLLAEARRPAAYYSQSVSAAESPALENVSRHLTENALYVASSRTFNLAGNGFSVKW